LLKNIEIVLIGVYTTNNSFEIISNFKKEDNRIILLKNSYNCGTIKFRNEAFKLSKGKYILITDSDDGLEARIFYIITLLLEIYEIYMLLNSIGILL